MWIAFPRRLIGLHEVVENEANCTFEMDASTGRTMFCQNLDQPTALSLTAPRHVDDKLFHQQNGEHQSLDPR